MEFWRETKPKARKERRCHACGQPIEVGRQYAYMAFKSDGEFWQTWQHLECRAAEIALANMHDLEGGEDWIHLNDLQEEDDFLWLQDNHPDAFERVKGRYSHWLEGEPS